MKRTILLLFVCLMGCTGDPAKLPTTQTSTAGNLSFWTANAALLPITVTIEGANSHITNNYSASAGCAASGSAIFTVLPRTSNYSWIASHGTQTWNGQVLVDKNTLCTAVEIK